MTENAIYVKRILYAILAIGYITIFIFSLRQFLNYLKVSKKRINILKIYYFSSFIIPIVRIIGILCYEESYKYDKLNLFGDIAWKFVIIFMLTTSILFFLYLIYDLYAHFKLNIESVYKNLKLFVIIYLILFWIAPITIYTLNRIDKSLSLLTYISSLIFLLIAAVLFVIIMYLYMTNLKIRRNMYIKKKSTMLLIILSIIFMIIVNITDISFDYFLIWDKMADILWHFLDWIFIIFTDLIPLLSYCIYFMKEAKYIIIYESTEKEYNDVSELLFDEDDHKQVL